MANWRDTYRPARFFVIDGRILFLIIPMLIHVRWYTVGPTVVVAAVLFYFEKRRDMDVPSAVRMARSWLAGPIRRGHFPGRFATPSTTGRPADMGMQESPVRAMAGETVIHVVYGRITTHGDALEADPALAEWLWLHGRHRYDRDLGLGVLSSTYLIGVEMARFGGSEDAVQISRMVVSPTKPSARAQARHGWLSPPASGPAVHGGDRTCFSCPATAALPPGGHGQAPLAVHT